MKGRLVFLQLYCAFMVHHNWTHWNPGQAGGGTDQRKEAEPGGFGVTLEDDLELVKELPLFNASLPFEHGVDVSPPFDLTLIVPVVRSILGQRGTTLLKTEPSPPVLLRRGEAHTWMPSSLADPKSSLESLKVEINGTLKAIFVIRKRTRFQNTQTDLPWVHGSDLGFFSQPIDGQS